MYIQYILRSGGYMRICVKLNKCMHMHIMRDTE